MVKKIVQSTKLIIYILYLMLLQIIKKINIKFCQRHPSIFNKLTYLIVQMILIQIFFNHQIRVTQILKIQKFLDMSFIKTAVKFQNK